MCMQVFKNLILLVLLVLPLAALVCHEIRVIKIFVGATNRQRTHIYRSQPFDLVSEIHCDSVGSSILSWAVESVWTYSGCRQWL